MMPKQEKVLKQHLGYWLNRLRNLVHRSFEDRLQKYELSVASWCILVSIYDASANSVNELAHYIEIDKAAISRLLDKLVSRGLLKHDMGKNRRSGIISLTPNGSQLVPLLIKEAEENDEHFFGLLRQDEQDMLRNIIRSLISSVSSIKLEGWLKENIH